MRSNSGVVKSDEAAPLSERRLKSVIAFTGTFMEPVFSMQYFRPMAMQLVQQGHKLPDEPGHSRKTFRPVSFMAKSTDCPRSITACRNVSVVKNDGGNCIFYWTDNCGVHTVRQTDKVILCAYCPSKRRQSFHWMQEYATPEK